MNKSLIRPTKSDLYRIIKESVRNSLREATYMKCCPYCANALKPNDNFCSNCGANLQEIEQKIRQFRMQQQMQGMQQQPMQQQPNANNNTMIDNRVQQQMQRNMALQQQMANRIRQQKMSKFG